MSDKKTVVSAYPAAVNIISRSKSIANVKNIARLLRKNYTEHIQSSKLIYSGGVCLSVKVSTVTVKDMLGQICEHSDIVCIGKNYEAIVCEYGKVIYEKNAIERLLS